MRARLLFGTDLGAFTVHEELGLLVEAGLSPYEALRTGTHDAAEFLGQLDEWWTVTAGRRADVVSGGMLIVTRSVAPSEPTNLD
jgi:imidazolonepropionase-like amidohydrolase